MVAREGKGAGGMLRAVGAEESEKFKGGRSAGQNTSRAGRESEIKVQ